MRSLRHASEVECRKLRYEKHELYVSEIFLTFTSYMKN